MAERLELVHTPELELSVLARQRADRRFRNLTHFAEQVRAWAARRNTARACIEWRFGVSDARDKLAHLSPTPPCDSLT